MLNGITNPMARLLFHSAFDGDFGGFTRESWEGKIQAVKGIAWQGSGCRWIGCSVGFEPDARACLAGDFVKLLTPAAWDSPKRFIGVPCGFHQNTVIAAEEARLLGLAGVNREAC